MYLIKNFEVKSTPWLVTDALPPSPMSYVDIFGSNRDHLYYLYSFFHLSVQMQIK
jgi:hypothetical protein